MISTVIKYVLSFAIVAVLTVSAFEAVMWSVVGPPATHMFTQSGQDVQTDFDVTYGVDSRGLRQSCPARGDETRRIALIGDSFAFGQGVKDREHLAALLSCGDDTVTVDNFGSVGQGLAYYEAATRTLLNDTHTDVVFLIYQNDLPALSSSGPVWALKTWLYSYSHTVVLVRLAKYRLNRMMNQGGVDAVKVEGVLNNPKAVILNDRDYIDSLVAPNTTRLELLRRGLTDLLTLAHDRAPQAKIFLTFVPDGSTVSGASRAFYQSLGVEALPPFGQPSAVQDTTLSACAAHPACTIIPLFDIFTAHGDRAYYEHDFHWTAVGHSLVAQRVAEVLGLPKP